MVSARLNTYSDLIGKYAVGSFIFTYANKEPVNLLFVGLISDHMDKAAP